MRHASDATYRAILAKVPLEVRVALRPELFPADATRSPVPSSDVEHFQKKYGLPLFQYRRMIEGIPADLLAEWKDEMFADPSLPDVANRGSPERFSALPVQRAPLTIASSEKQRQPSDPVTASEIAARAREYMAKRKSFGRTINAIEAVNHVMQEIANGK